MEKKKIKKICFVITQGEIGGAQMYVRDLASLLPPDEFKITIAHGQKPNDWLDREARAAGIKTDYLRFVKRALNPLYDFLGYLELCHYFKKQKFDIVHLNSSKVGVLGARAAKKAKIKKIIFTCHGWAFDDPRPAGEKAVYKSIYRYLAKYVDKIITVSEYARRAGLGIGLPADKMVTIHNGLNIERIKLFTRAEARKILHENYHLPIDKKIVATVANFYPTKGVKYLLSAAKIYLAKDSQTIFCIIGSGQQYAEFQNFIKVHKLTDRVFLLTNITNASQLMPAFDLFVLTSLKECLPYVLLEAANAGLPIVATDVGGNPEVLNYYPNQQYKLVSAKNPTETAQAIAEMLPQQNLFAAELEAIRHRISISNMVRQTARLYY